MQDNHVSQQSNMVWDGNHSNALLWLLYGAYIHTGVVHISRRQRGRMERRGGLRKGWSGVPRVARLVWCIYTSESEGVY